MEWPAHLSLVRGGGVSKHLFIVLSSRLLFIIDLGIFVRV